MYPPERVSTVLALVDDGASYSEIAPATGVSRSTIRDRIAGRKPSRQSLSACLVCRGRTDHIPSGPYAYLLGLYLGDGYIATHRRGVYRLRITCCDAIPVSCSIVRWPWRRSSPTALVGCFEPGAPTSTRTPSIGRAFFLNTVPVTSTIGPSSSLSGSGRSSTGSLLLFSAALSIPTAVVCSTTSTAGPTLATSSRTPRTTSEASSLERVTSWAWNGARALLALCRWPAGRACKPWMNSSASSASWARAIRS